MSQVKDSYLTQSFFIHRAAIDTLIFFLTMIVPFLKGEKMYETEFQFCRNEKAPMPAPRKGLKKGE